MAEIFKNSAGQVFKNSTGDAFKSNFPFGNGWVGDGTNDYFNIPYLVGLDCSDYTIEFWSKGLRVPSNHGVFVGWRNSAGAILFIVNLPSGSDSGIRYFAEDANVTPSVDIYKKNYHHIFVRGGDTQAYLNNASVLQRLKVNGRILGTPYIGFTANLNYLKDGLIDEFRVYSRLISSTETSKNYNLGNGAEPFDATGMIIRYKFEKYEQLDFSAAQDGTDIRWGVRNHGSIPHAHAEIKNVADPTLQAEFKAFT
jgi:hypothetical protein